MTGRKAVIFDMDGVLVDSEALWKQAENEVFSSLGVIVSEEFSEQTKTMTTDQVTSFWFDKFPWQSESFAEVELKVIDRVIELIKTNDCIIIGVKEFIENLRSNNFKIGLATNSPASIISTVLKKLKASHLFDAVSSAEDEEHGKPDPAVYVTTAKKLNVATTNCIVIEDSHSGMVAAKKAGMTVVAFTNNNPNLNFEIANYRIDSFKEFNTDIFN